MRRPALVGGLRNALKQAMDGLFWSQIKHTVSHFKLAASRLVRRSLLVLHSFSVGGGEGGRLSNHLNEKTFEKRYNNYDQEKLAVLGSAKAKR